MADKPADKLRQLLDSLVSAASKIKTPISLAALTVLVIFMVVFMVVYLVVHSNLPSVLGIICATVIIIAVSIVCVVSIFTAGKGTPPKEDISEPTSFSTDLRVKQELWKILDGALSSLGFTGRKVSEVENLMGMNYEFSWAKGGEFSLFIVQLKPKELSPDAIFQLRGIKDELIEKRNEHVKILIICDVQQIFDGLHYSVLGSDNLILLTHYGIHQTERNPDFLKNLLKLNALQ